MKLAALFCDHAVLQQGMPIPVWGWCQPKARVEVKLGKQVVEYFAGNDGKFMVRFPAMAAGGPYELSATDRKSGKTAVCHDVWVGEVWLASGQSNMEWTLEGLDNGRKDAERSLPDLRIFNVPHYSYPGRQSDLTELSERDKQFYCQQSLAPLSWIPAGAPGTISCSAVAYYFGSQLQNALGVKIGVINSSWGGTIAEAWTSRETLTRNPEMTARLASYEAQVNRPDFWSDYPDRTLQLECLQMPAGKLPADHGNAGLKKGWAKPDFNDESWPEMTLPSCWQEHGENYSGVLWFRKTVNVPAAWAGKDLQLEIGAVDKQDITYFNGKKVGATGKGFETNYWNQPRSYRVPGNLVKAGKNVIAVRVYSFIYAGGMIGPEKTMNLTVAGNGKKSLPLAGSWHYQTEQNFGLTPIPQLKLGPGNPNSPAMLFDNMIAPLIPYAFRGAVWYQGESNSNNAGQYRRVLRDMICDWRFHWGQGDFPFIQVQLANFNASLTENWPIIREAQFQVFRDLPNNGMASAIDIGEPDNIHPRYKAEVGRRLALWALTETYGKPGIPSGPLFRNFTIEADAIRIRFDYADGLTAKGGTLRGFLLAGNDRTFVPANAVVDGTTIVISHPDVKNPMAVRYDWANNPDGNLYNRAGLPASPFRTDSWPC